MIDSGACPPGDSRIIAFGEAKKARWKRIKLTRSNRSYSAGGKRDMENKAGSHFEGNK